MENGESITESSMEKRIELEKRGRKPEEVDELTLDNCRSTQISGITDEFENLMSLSLVNCGLTTLKGFPVLKNLRRLELSDNRISSGLEHLHGCIKLTALNLSGNKIKDLDALEPLKKLSALTNLELFSCDVTNLENYREKVFEIVENLVYLDGFDRNNQEEGEDDDDISGEEDEDSEGAAGANGGDDSEEGDEGDEDVDDEDDSDDEEGDGTVDSEVGLSYLQNTLEDDDEGDEFVPGDPEDDDDIDDEDEDGGAADAGIARGLKRKRGTEEKGEDKDD